MRAFAKEEHYPPRKTKHFIMIKGFLGESLREPVKRSPPIQYFFFYTGDLEV